MKKNILIIITHKDKILLEITNVINKFKKSFNNKANLFFKFWDENNIYNFIKKNNIDGIILTGSKYRILKLDKYINEKFNILIEDLLKTKKPIIGLCFGYQLLIKYFCNINNCIKTFKYEKNNKYNIRLKINKPFKIRELYYFCNHHDYIVSLPKNFKKIIKYKNIIYMSYNKNLKILGLQFHPEHNEYNGKLFYNKWLNYI